MTTIFFLDWPRQVLQRLGMDTEVNTRNAILCQGKKISGSAQFAGRNKLLTHCTLLVDSNLNHSGGIDIFSTCNPFKSSFLRSFGGSQFEILWSIHGIGY